MPSSRLQANTQVEYCIHNKKQTKHEERTDESWGGRDPKISCWETRFYIAYLRYTSHNIPPIMTTSPPTIYQSTTEKKSLRKQEESSKVEVPLVHNRNRHTSTIGVGNRAEGFYCGMASRARLSCEPSLQQESAGWVSASSVQPEAKASQEAACSLLRVF